MTEFSSQTSEHFPLDPERIERSLDAIREDPALTLLDVESTYLEFQNPNLAFLLTSGMRAMSDQHAQGFTEGALTIYKIMREAGTFDGSLPVLSEQSRADMAGSLVARFLAAKSMKPVPTVARLTRVLLEPELEKEPSVLALVKRLAEHRLDRDAYYAGAATVVAGLRRALAEQ